jgi:hypothetical protein
MDSPPPRHLQSAAAENPVLNRAAITASAVLARRRHETWSSEEYWSAPYKRFLWQNLQNRQMKKSLPHFSALAAFLAMRLAVAQSPPAESPSVQAEAAPQIEATAVQQTTAASAAGDTSGNSLLTQVASKLERRASIAARLRHQIAVGGQDLYGVGSYWQQGSGEELKIRLELQIAGQEAQLLQISNSRFLWIDRRLPSGRNVVRYDLRQLRTDPTLAPTTDLDKLDPGKANWSSIQPLLTAHSGGLPSLLTSLNENFAFMPPQTMRLAIEPTAGEAATSLSVYAVVGHWKQEKLAALLAKADDANNPKPAKALKVPDRLPQEVLLLVGQSDLFPYRIEYRKLETPTATAVEGPPIPYQLSVHPLVVLELSDVVFDAPIAAGQFDYTPGDADWVDQTAVLLERLRRTRQAQVATRSSDQTELPR